MAEVGVGKSNIFQSPFAQYLQLAKDRGGSSSHSPNHNLRLATRSKSETDLVFLTIGGSANYTEEKGVADTNETKKEDEKEVRKRRSSDGTIDTAKQGRGRERCNDPGRRGRYRR